MDGMSSCGTKKNVAWSTEKNEVAFFSTTKMIAKAAKIASEAINI